MKVLVAYASRHGATEGIAERVAETLARGGLDVSLREIGHVSTLDGFDAFVIGSAAYMGRWEKHASQFVRDHENTIASRPVWLFSSGPIGTELVDKKGRDVVEASRPVEFAEFAPRLQPRDEKVFFGAYDPTRHDATFAERLIMKVPAIRDAMPKGDFRDWDAIEAWAESIVRQLTPVGAPA